ncbi:MAG: metallophosphoesterase [Candidatus Omnitrophota bacterium]|nr:metallophosphoesterase [Candidatus Omnitrophota bacterium]
MRYLIKIIIITILAALIYSILPIIPLYLQKDVVLPTNDQIVQMLKANKGEVFSFIAFGDNHAGFIFDDSAFLKLIRRINRENRFKKLNIDFMVNLGDISFIKGTEWDYRLYNRLRAKIKWPVISLMGNHDDEKGSDRRFKKYLGKKELAFTDRNSYFIVLDNNITALSEEQCNWLEQELQKSTSYAHRFIFMHKQAMSLYQQSWFRPELGAWSYRFMKLCEKYKVDIVFAGHEHMFREAVYGGVRYVISGGAGMLTQIPESEGGYLHYLVVRVYGDYVDFEVRKVFPPLWEYFTYYMWKELFYSVKDIVT